MSVATPTAAGPLPLEDAPHHAARLPVLDGVRGLAILLVMGHHLFVIPKTVGADGVEHYPTRFDAVVASVVHSGWWGVDLFFVLSGFLITGILFDSKGGRHYYRNFYARRTVRIFPLYYAFLLLMLVALPAMGRFLKPETVRVFGESHSSQVWYWAYLSNFRTAWLGVWEHKTLSVTWSLAIEEQFYLVWPAVVLFLGRRGLMRVCAAMIIASTLTRLGLILFDEKSEMKIYCMTACRLDGLAVGAWIALSLRAPKQDVLKQLKSLAKGVGVVAVSAIACSIAFIEKDHPLDSIFYTALALAFGSLLVGCLAARPGEWLWRIFNCSPLRVFGTYSYAIYLFHYPVAIALSSWVFKPIQFPKLAGSPMPGQLLFYALATAVTLAIAWVSWNLFEKHFLKLKKYFPSGK